MRKLFVDLISKEMQKNNKIFLLTADLGFGLFDEIRKNHSNRFYNVGSSEQLMVGAAVGIAQSGFIPVCYSITPFLIARPYELLRNYLNHEKTPVKLVGSGRNRDYSHDGFTHWAEDDVSMLSAFLNIQIYSPITEQEIVEDFNDFLYNNHPAYLNLKR